MTLSQMLDQARAAPPYEETIRRAALIDRAYLIDAWRLNSAAIDEHLFWIKQHRETIRARRERPEYIAYAERMLAERLRRYRRAVRYVTEAEADMTAAGIPFNRYGA